MINIFYFERKLIALKFWCFMNINCNVLNIKEKDFYDQTGFMLTGTKGLPPFSEWWENCKQDFLDADKQSIKWVSE